jgi:hypothetical protein
MAALPAIATLAILTLAAHGVAQAVPVETKSPAAAKVTPGCRGAGALRAKLHGAINREVVWDDSVMSCDGSIRPDGSGLRLTATGPLPGSPRSLRIVLGIAGAKPGTDADDRPANLTLIVGTPGRIYATRGDSKCTVDELRQAPLAGKTALPGDKVATRIWRVTARGFCVGPAATLDGGSRILVSRFDLQTDLRATDAAE